MPVWLKAAGITWASARLLSALLSTVLGALIYTHVCQQSRSLLAATGAALLYAASALVFAWYPIVKTFSLTALFLFASYLLLVRKSSSAASMAGLAGLFFGLSVSTRSYIIAVVPVFLCWIWVASSVRRVGRMVWFGAGVATGLAPAIVLFVASPDAFLFNNLGYHALRTEHGLVGNWHNKLITIRLLFSGAHTGVQFTLLTAACAVLLFFKRGRLPAALFAFSIAFALGLISLLPTPTELQYFSLSLPFLIVAASCSATVFARTLDSPFATRAAGGVCVAFIAIFVLAGVPTLRSYLHTGVNVPGIMISANAPGWTLPQVIAVSENINRLTPRGQQVVSFWPGYLFASHAEPYPGFENDFGLYVARFVTPEERRRYHILTGEEMIDDFVEHLPEWAVVGNQGAFVGGPDVGAATAVLHNNGYVLVSTVGHAAIYRCCVRQSGH